MIIKDFQNILETQTDLFKQFARHQHDLQNALMDKDYLLAEQSMEAMAQLSSAIHEGEEWRQASFANLIAARGIAPDASVTVLMELLEPAARKELARVFRDFKVAVFQTRSFNEGIRAYSNSQMGTMEDIIDELYPKRRNGTYTADGQRQKTTEPLVLDHSL